MNDLLPYVRKRMAGRGLVHALRSDVGLSHGVAVVEGRTVGGALAREPAMDHRLFQSVLPLRAGAR